MDTLGASVQNPVTKYLYRKIMININALVAWIDEKIKVIDHIKCGVPSEASKAYTQLDALSDDMVKMRDVYKKTALKDDTDKATAIHATDVKITVTPEKTDA